MKGSIRFLMGLVLTAGAAGGVDTATDQQLPLVILAAALGLALIYSATRAFKEQQ